MNLTDSEKMKAARGNPILVNNICYVYPTLLSQIETIGLEKFSLYLKVLTDNNPDLPNKDLTEEEKQFFTMISQMSSYEYLFFLASVDQDAARTIKDAFKFFIHNEVLLIESEQKIMLVGFEEQIFIDEETFYMLSEKIRLLHWLEPTTTINSDDSEEVKKIKQKLLDRKKILDKIKAKSAQADDVGFFDLIGSVLIKIFNLNIFNVWDISYYYFYDCLKRLNVNEEFEMSIKARLAGAKIDAPLKNWIRRIDTN